MAAPKKHVTFGHDDDFRKGACHASAWFLQTTQTLVSEGRTAGEIAGHLKDLLGVVTEWRSGAGELPDGNPWDWSYRDLASVIKARKGE
jgi:hypothetical protein